MDASHEETSLLERDVRKGVSRRPRVPPRCIPITAMLLVILTVSTTVCLLGMYLYTDQSAPTRTDRAGSVTLIQDDPDEPRLLSSGKGHEGSPYGWYKHQAVATEVAHCSQIGESFLERGGSSVDAAIASLLCVGVYHMTACGIGGGSIHMVYERPRWGGPREMVAIDAREVAPEAASRDMLDGGGSGTTLVTGVPGEIAGYHALWRRYGRLTWSELFTPTIELCEEGFKVGAYLADKFQSYKDKKPEDVNKGLREIVFNSYGEVHQENDVIRLPKLAKTLKRIADHGAKEFYRGELARDMVEDIKDTGGIIAESDLANYRVVHRPLRMFNMTQAQLQFVTPTLPYGGPVLELTVKLLDGFDWDDVDLVTKYHRLVETMKFTFAVRTKYGDPDFADMDQLMANLDSAAYVDKLRCKIDDDRTHNISYYGPLGQGPNNKGTAHISVYSRDGGAVASTSTINGAFGSDIVGERTGIMFNDEMMDFNTDPDAETNNAIEPGKRPVSSMTPTLAFDLESHDLRLIMGGSGSKIILSTLQYVIFQHYVLGKNLVSSIERPRLAHVLIPNEITAERTVSQNLLDGLRAKGHVINTSGALESLLPACQAIEINPDDAKPVLAVADKRKLGQTAGG